MPVILDKQIGYVADEIVSAAPLLQGCFLRESQQEIRKIRAGLGTGSRATRLAGRKAGEVETAGHVGTALDILANSAIVATEANIVCMASPGGSVLKRDGLIQREFGSLFADTLKL